MKVFSISLLTCCCMQPILSWGADIKHPNVIIIMTDQQSYNAISAYRHLMKGVYANTPNIDRLFNNGTSFARTYCANPVSVASRFALFTGMYGGKYGVRENHCGAADETAIRILQRTNAMGNIFQRGGYETYYAGKVHLPFASEIGNNKFVFPKAYGFQQYLTNNEREELGGVVASFISARKVSDKPFLLVSSFLNPHDICLEAATNLSGIVHGDKKDKTDCINKVRQDAASYDSLTFYSKMVPALPSNFDKPKNYPELRCEKNRFLNFPDWYWQKYRWIYARLVSLVDAQIGKILDALDANPSLKANTIIVFTSDHGEMQGAHHCTAKSLPFEECQRVPFVFCGQNIPKGRVDSTLTCNGVDLLPTICDLAHISKPQNTDGLSLAYTIMKGKRPVKRDYIYIESEDFITLINNQFKYSLFDSEDNKELLFDVGIDGGELYNISGDKRFSRQMAEFRTVITKYKNDLPVSMNKHYNMKKSQKRNLQNQKRNLMKDI